MIEQICEKLNKEVDKLFIQRITKNNKCIYVYLSDQYGNNAAMPPLGFDLKSGEEIFVDYNYDYLGMDCEIPDQYNTYRNMVYDKLEKTVPSELADELEPYGVVYPINAIFTEYICDVEVSQLYAICNYLLNAIVVFCNNEEKEKFSQLMNNELIRSYIRLPIEEKLKIVDDCYFMPEYIEKIFTISDELLEMAVNKQAGGSIDPESYREIKEKLKSAIENGKEELPRETDPFCNMEIIGGKLERLIADVEQEFSYCENRSDMVSERMKEEESSRSFFTEEGEFKIEAFLDDVFGKYGKLIEEEDAEEDVKNEEDMKNEGEDVEDEEEGS